MEPQTSTFQAIGEEDDSQKRIQELEKELARLKADWEENEKKVRDKCCDAWREVVTKMRDSSNQHYQKIKARYEECFKNQRLQNQILQHSNQHLQEQQEKLKDSLVNLEEKLMKGNGQFGHLNTELREVQSGF